MLNEKALALDDSNPIRLIHDAQLISYPDQDGSNHPYDNDVFVRDVIRLIFEFWFTDYSLVECVDGNEGLAEIGRQAPDLLITDYGHPGPRTDEMLSELSKRPARFPIIVVSAFLGSFPELQQRLLRFRFDVQFLHKPFLARDLKASVEKHLVNDNSNCTCSYARPPG